MEVKGQSHRISKPIRLNSYQFVVLLLLLSIEVMFHILQSLSVLYLTLAEAVSLMIPFSSDLVPQISSDEQLT